MNPVENFFQPQTWKVTRGPSPLISRFLERALERSQADQAVKVELSFPYSKERTVKNPETYQPLKSFVSNSPKILPGSSKSHSTPEDPPATTTKIGAKKSHDLTVDEFRKALGSTSSNDENYNSLADFDDDGDVDGSDLAVFAKHFSM